MVAQYKALWTIPGAGPSVSTFHSAGPMTGAQAAFWALTVRKFFDDVKGLLPNDVSVNFDTEVTEYDTASGVLTGTISVAAPAVVLGGAAGAWAGGAGVRLVWLTSRILDGRRVRGATFLVPAAAVAFDTNGAVSATGITTANNAASTYLAAMTGSNPVAVVYSRPRPASDTLPARPGTETPISGRSASAIVGTLRGRKY